MPADFDAIAIGAGHNALVAANLLAERGWSVVVLEADAEPGGAIKSGEITAPGFTSDLFSAFYPLAGHPLARTRAPRAALAADAGRGRPSPGRRNVRRALHRSRGVGRVGRTVRARRR